MGRVGHKAGTASSWVERTCGGADVHQGLDVDELPGPDAAVAAQAEHRHRHPRAPPGLLFPEGAIRAHHHSWRCRATLCACGTQIHSRQQNGDRD